MVRRYLRCIARMSRFCCTRRRDEKRRLRIVRGAEPIILYLDPRSRSCTLLLRKVYTVILLRCDMLPMPVQWARRRNLIDHQVMNLVASDDNVTYHKSRETENDRYHHLGLYVYLTFGDIVTPMNLWSDGVEPDILNSTMWI
jgi:hypothetical protein